MTSTNTKEIKFKRLKHHSNDLLKDLYYAIKKPRMIERKMLIYLRKGLITKWFAGIGQEAIAVGAAMAMAKDEYILPMHRNLGVFTSRNIPLYRLFAQWQGKMSGFTKGRDRSFHFGTNEYHIVGMISHLGPQLAVGSGIALGHKLKENQKVTLAFSGEGGTSEGDFHEALNVASVWDLPVIFLVENNGYGLSTPVAEQFRAEKLSDKGIGYGMEAVTIDGNNILEVYDTIMMYRESLKKKPRPILIEAMTFRMHGHEEASGVKYVPQEKFDYWKPKDPVENFENWLLSEGVIDESFKETVESQIEEEIISNWAMADAEPIVEPSEQEEKDIYAGRDQITIKPKSSSKNSLRFVDAISESLSQSMDRFDNLIIMGQDVAEYGGVFKITQGFVERYGKHRVRNTPLCESAILGIGLGLSINDHKSVVEMQFADFVTCGFNQIINNLSKSHYRWGQNADVVVRMPTGGTVAAGPFHSQSNEAWFFHSPGLKIVYPSSPYDAKGLLNAAIEDTNPVMYFEHKALYRSLSDEVPEDYYTIEIGKANLIKEGEDLSIISYGLGVHWAVNALEKNLDISADVLDLRSLVPLDRDAIISTVKKTGKVIIVHEDSITGGIGAEIAAIVSENCFEHLDAPIMRCGALDTPVPFAKTLEDAYMPIDRFEKKLRKLADY